MPNLTDSQIQKRVEELSLELSSQDPEVRLKAGREVRSLYRILRLRITELSSLESSGDIGREDRKNYLLMLIARVHRISTRP